MTGIEDPAPRRFRSFVARPAPPSPPPSAAAVVEAEADLPVLTEIVVPDSAASRVEAVDPVALGATLEEDLNRWLDAALPAALSAATPQLLVALKAEAHQALMPNLLEQLKHGIARQKF